MNSFALAKPATFAAAHRMIREGTYSLPMFKGGGMDIVDHLKEGLLSPDLLIDVRGLRLNDDVRSGVTQETTGFRIEAACTLAEMAESPLLNRSCPVVAQACASAATPAVRNVATAAGNLLQRPRCWYYRNSQFDCLKKGGATCFAVDGENAHHAVFGEGPCHIVHPSNLAPALNAVNAMVHLMGGDRPAVPIAKLFHMPDKGVTSEHNLAPGEIITHITFDLAPKSGFYAVKEKQSFDWPSAFACVSLELDGDRINKASVFAGAVAPVPWPLPKVAEALAGVKADDDAGIAKAAAFAVEGAKPMRDNGYKLKLLQVVVRRAVATALGRPVPGLS